MIPHQSHLKSRVTSESLAYVITRGETYFETAEEFVRLNKIFSYQGIFAYVSLWADMIISPLITILMAIYYQEPPGIFSVISIQKTVNLWSDWFLYEQIKKEVHEWTQIVKSIGGPFISTNDPTYHIYVYADAMQRIHYSFFPKN